MPWPEDDPDLQYLVLTSEDEDDTEPGPVWEVVEASGFDPEDEEVKVLASLEPGYAVNVGPGGAYGDFHVIRVDSPYTPYPDITDMETYAPGEVWKPRIQRLYAVNLAAAATDFFLDAHEPHPEAPTSAAIEKAIDGFDGTRKSLMQIRAAYTKAFKAKEATPEFWRAAYRRLGIPI